MLKQSIEIPYGKKHLSFTPPSGVKVKVLRSKKRKGLADPTWAAFKAMTNPIDTAPINEIARGKRSAAVVISDITRPVPNEMILDMLLPMLEGNGIPRSQTIVIIGTGTHRAATPEEIVTLVGRKIAHDYTVVSHDCRSGNVRVDSLTNPITRDEIPIEIDRRYVEADLKILTGLVEPHIFCGYSGGRKAILPGLASLSTIRKWHCPEIVAHPNSTPGVVRDNVAHELTTEVARTVGADFTVNVTLNRDREVTGVFAGGFEEVFAAAVERLESYVLTPATEPAKVVVTSSAGWPLDTTFYQAIKGLVAILPMMAQDGVVVLCARCDEGYGDPLFSELIRSTKDVAAWSRGLHSKCKFQLGQWQWQRMGWTRERGRVFLVSDLCKRDACIAQAVPCPSLQNAVDTAFAETGADRMIVVPEGPYVVTQGA